MPDNRFELTPDQAKIVECDASAILVVAGGGTGKTEVVARRIERLVNERSSTTSVLALTYTTKAATELQDRIRDRLGDRDGYVEAKTIHKFAHSLLIQFGTHIGLPPNVEVLSRLEDRVELLMQWLEGMNLARPGDVRATFNLLDLGRARLEEPPLLKEWDAALNSTGAVDYASMLSRAAELLVITPIHRTTAGRYGHVVVDEAQNLTPSQYRLLRLLIGQPGTSSRRISTMLVGDEKQAVIEFAGGDPHLMEEFGTQYKAERFELRENFRSARDIAKLSDTVATSLGSSRSKRSPSIRYPASGRVDRHEAAGEAEEGRYVAGWTRRLLDDGIPTDRLAPGERSQLRPEDIAVLARSSAVLTYTQRALRRMGIETATASSSDSWLSTDSGRAIRALIDLHANPGYRAARRQASRTLKIQCEDLTSMSELALRLEEGACFGQLAPICRMTGPESLLDTLHKVSPVESDNLEKCAAWDADVRLIEDTWREFADRTHTSSRTWAAFSQHVMWAQRGRPMDPGVRLLTVHKSQGREFRAVAVVGLNQGQFPDFRATTDEALQAELRIFYVAVTRPSRMLLLTRARTRNGRYGPYHPQPSEFVDWN